MIYSKSEGALKTQTKFSIVVFKRIFGDEDCSLDALMPEKGNAANIANKANFLVLTNKLFILCFVITIIFLFDFLISNRQTLPKPKRRPMS